MFPSSSNFQNVQFIINAEELKSFGDQPGVIPAWVETRNMHSANLNKMNKIVVKRPVYRLV